jgi:hypothetical protein
MTKRMRQVVTAIAAIAALATGGAVFAQAQNSGKPEPAQGQEAGDEREEGEREADGREEERDARATGPQADRAEEAALKATGGGTATSVAREESEREERERESERESEDTGGDEQKGFQSPQGAAWEVEVTKPDGTQVEVYLDKDYMELATHKADSDE